MYLVLFITAPTSQSKNGGIKLLCIDGTWIAFQTTKRYDFPSYRQSYQSIASTTSAVITCIAGQMGSLRPFRLAGCNAKTHPPIDEETVLCITGCCHDMSFFGFLRMEQRVDGFDGAFVSPRCDAMASRVGEGTELFSLLVSSSNSLAMTEESCFSFGCFMQLHFLGFSFCHSQSSSCSSLERAEYSSGVW